MLRTASRHVTEELRTAGLTELELFNDRDMIGWAAILNNSPKYKHNFDRVATWTAAIIRPQKGMKE